MTPFEGKAIRLAGVQLQELHARFTGPSSSIMTKVAFVTDEGIPVSVSIFSSLSPETIAKIHEATRSVERDFIRFMALPELEQGEESSSSEDFEVGGFPSR